MKVDKRNSIENRSLRYFLLYNYARHLFYMYYRKVYITGKENIPDNQPVIFAPNHQNALMDALAVLFSLGKAVVFLARADIFKKKRTSDFLNLIKILPVYRMRDGVSNLQKNDDVFNHTVRILRKKTPIGIMPEGNHGDKYRIRPFVKGIFRIAFNTQEVLNAENSKKVQIVPVGLNYDHYVKYNRPLLINYGKPIDVSKFLEEYRVNAPKTVNKLKKELSEKLSELVIDIHDEEYYDLINDLRDFYYKKMIKSFNIGRINFINKFRADKKMIDILYDHKKSDPEWFYKMNDLIREYYDGLHKLQLRNWVLESEQYYFFPLFLNSVLLIITLPVFLYGFLHNIIPFIIPHRFVRKIKDKQFHSSFKFVLSLILFPVFYIIFGLFFGLMIQNFWFTLVYLVSLPVSGMIAFRLYVLYKKNTAKWRYKILLKNNNNLLENLKKTREEIMMKMDNLIKKYL